LDDDLKKIPLGAGPDASSARGPHASEDSGLLEAALLGRGLSPDEIQARAEANEADRNEQFRNHFEKIAICSLWGFYALFVLLVLTWFWHTLSPECVHWLTSEQISKVQALATGGILATIAAGHLKKRLN
jgi:hypothetical protein